MSEQSKGWKTDRKRTKTKKYTFNYLRGGGTLQRVYPVEQLKYEPNNNQRCPHGSTCKNTKILALNHSTTQVC